MILSSIEKTTMMYGTIDEKYRGVCYLNGNKLDCLTTEEQNKILFSILFGLFILHLIHYRLTN
jgi:hypothetical protein